MVHYFKLAGQRMVLDCASGYIANVDEMTYKMLVYLTTPLPADCPSAIRYDMAKYDSALVDKTYAAILADHKAGRLYTDIPFDAERSVTLHVLSSDAPCTVLDNACAPVLLLDTDRAENAAALCRAAKDKGLCVTVHMTAEGDYPCDRLLVCETLHKAYRDKAPTVGVWFTYDVRAPKLLDKLTALADDGITLIDAVPETPADAAFGAQTVLIKELGKVAKELFLREKEGRAVEFLPFSVMERGAKFGDGAFSAPCMTCSHRTRCGGMCYSTVRDIDADCELRRTLADASILLELNRK